MKENQDSNNSNRHMRRARSKRHALHGFICLLLILSCCLAVFAFDLLTNDFTFSIDKYLNALLGVQSNTDETAWYLILVNKWNHIPDNYEVELTELANGKSIDKRIYPSLQKMFDTARSNKVYPVVASGYRTAKEQQDLLDAKVAEYRAGGSSAKEAKIKAETWVAVPGASEHQLGIAVDINADGINSTGEEVYEWLNRTAYKFGFIRRYPPDKTEITGVSNEPWHYRYVGVDAATEIYKKGVCLEEYLNEPPSEVRGFDVTDTG